MQCPETFGACGTAATFSTYTRTGFAWVKRCRLMWSCMRMHSSTFHLCFALQASWSISLLAGGAAEPFVTAVLDAIMCTTFMHTRRHLLAASRIQDWACCYQGLCLAGSVDSLIRAPNASDYLMQSLEKAPTRQHFKWEDY